MQALIDGDIIVYRACTACEYTVYQLCIGGRVVKEVRGRKDLLSVLDKLPFFSANEYVRLEPLSHVLYNINSIIDRIMQHGEFSTCKVFISGDTNFRTDLAKIQPYKGNRPRQRPYYYDAAREYLVKKHRAEVSVGCEADDLLGIYATAADYNKVSVVTIDKDLDMIPGYHFNWVKGNMYYISPEEGMRNFYTQCITGDSVDNIKGCEGYGIKKADKILAGAVDESDYITRVYTTYVNVYGTGLALQYFLENANLLWIMREPGVIYDQRREFKQWHSEFFN